MNLLAFRELFLKTSGRYDLVDADTFADNGLDFHLNSGQRYLDRLADIPAAIARVFKDIDAGDMMVTFQDCRSILEAWCIGDNSDGDKERLPLQKKYIEDLKGIDMLTLEKNYTAMYSDMTQSRPVYFSPAQLRLKKDTNGLSGGVGGFMDVLPDGEQTYNGIVFMPPSDGDYTIEVVGHFYNPNFSADTDTTFWSERHADLLLMATLRQLEIFQRNTAGVNDWTLSIGESIIGIDMDGVAESVSDIEEMEG